MAKRQKKSLADLMDSSAPDNRQIEQAVQQIHQTVIPKPQKEKVPTKRVTVDTPTIWHKELKKIIADLDTDLKHFYLQAVREKCERLGQPLPEINQ